MFPLGVTTNTFVVTDGSGNTAVCSFTVTVTDNEDPQITCPANSSVDTDVNMCSAVVNYAAPVGSDNCSGAMTTQTAGLSGGSMFPLGVSTNTFVVSDGAGNTAACSFTVTVTDNEDPQITCPASSTVDTDVNMCSAVVNYTSPVGTDNCGGSLTTQTAGLTSGSMFPLGVTTNTFVVTDGAGNTAQCSFTVTVIDNEDPQITCPANSTVDTDANMCSAVVNYISPIGSDNCSGSSTMQTTGLSGGSMFPLGVTTNTFVVTDGSGNTAQCSFTVTVTDNEDPQITCPANSSVDTDVNMCSAVVNYTAPIGTDNCSGSMTTQTVGLTGGSMFPLGVTTNTFVVTDGSGNTAQCSFTLTVTDNEDPMITCPANVTVNTDTGLCTASNVVIGSASASDNCNLAILPSNNAVEPYQRGINNITWTADDGNGNTSVCIQTITVLYPEINLTGNGQTIENGDNMTSSLDFTDFGPQSPGSQTDKTFVIQNIGSQTLHLTGMPIVVVTGDAEFSVVTQPSSTGITSGGPALSFQIRYAPVAAGNHTALISVLNNDCDESTYTFTVSSCATTVYYKDQDGDGYGNADSVKTECTQPLGYVTNNDDCNDNSSALNIQAVVYSHDGVCYATLEDALDMAGSTAMQEVLIHADASPNEINIIPAGVTVRVLSGTWSNHMMLKNNGTIILENGSSFKNVSGGVYKGKGSFNGNFQNMGGVMSPGE
ncbi:MAG: HYR domain-containing protein [Saprospiraceae bacterium]|nr:HYR domain-containing protein [Saprospiraceae bacterium]